MGQKASLDYRVEHWLRVLVLTVAACALGWALALALGRWAEVRGAPLAPWRPPALPALDMSRAATAPSPGAGAARLVGVAGRRAYFMLADGAAGASRSLALDEGERLPSGERLLRVERDAVVLGTAGRDMRVELRPAPVPAAPKAGMNTSCRLSAADRAVARFLDPSVVKALQSERATFARMFEALPNGAGIRARDTAGTTAMFAIDDGDVLSRIDGAPIRSAEAIVTDILGRLAAGGAVVVEGERRGAPRRWVLAPKACATGVTNAAR